MHPAMTTMAKFILATVAAVSVLIFGLSVIQDDKYDSDGPRRRNGFDSYQELDRNLQTTVPSDEYYTITDKSILGVTNPDVTAGNPLKGLVTSPHWTGTTTPAMLPTSLEFYYVGLDEIMIGDNKFDWSVLDQLLTEAESRYKHVIWRVYCHYPGRPLAVPQYILDQGLDIDEGSPVYDDVRLLTALEQFIKALGARYDGHKALAFVQMGLLGYWGEWHTYPDDNLLSDDVKMKVYSWYKSAFKVTKLQARDPIDAPAGEIGFHDDSFAYSTLGTYHWFFWPKLVASGNSEAWTKNVIGGETSPNLQSIIFEPWYVPGSDKNKQSFMECVKTTHATYMIHGNAFKSNGYTGRELDNARFAHTRMGYNYIITKIGATSTSATTITVNVNIMQIGVAPFYYPLSLVLSCPGTKRQVHGLEQILDDTNDVKNYQFDGIPIDETCLQSMKLQLVSTYSYEERPIKFAQGNGNVVFSLPAPTKTSSKLTLIDAATEVKIREITNNMVINIADYKSINILAEPPSSFVDGSVEFSIDGNIVRVENFAPFISGGPSDSWRPSLGNHIIKVTPYEGKDLLGSALASTIVTVVVVDERPVPTRSPVMQTRSPIIPPTVANLMLTLIDAHSNLELGEMTDGMKIDLFKHPLLNIKVDVAESLSANRVEFYYDGERIRIEYNAPYSFYGNSDKDYFGWKPTVGEHFVEVRAFRDQSLAAWIAIKFSTVR